MPPTEEQENGSEESFQERFRAIIGELLTGFAFVAAFGLVVVLAMLRKDGTPNFDVVFSDPMLAEIAQTIFCTVPVILAAHLFVRFYRVLEELPAPPPEGRQATINRWIVLVGSLFVGAGLMAVLTSTGFFGSDGLNDYGDSFQYLLLPWLITLGAFWHLHRLRLENTQPDMVMGIFGPFDLMERMPKPAAGEETNVGDDNEQRASMAPPPVRSGSITRRTPAGGVAVSPERPRHEEA